METLKNFNAHCKLIKEAVEQNGGCTYHVVLNKLADKKGYFVSLKDHERTIEKLTSDEINIYIGMHKDLFSKRDHFFGVWKDGDKYVMDVSFRVMDRRSAIEAGIKNNQKAIYDAENDEVIMIEDQSMASEKLEQMMKDHDWHYQRSDDPSKWRAGESSYGRIMAAMHLMQNKSEAKRLWNKYCPWAESVVDTRDKEIKEAMATLQKHGYFTDVMWSLRDVQSKFSCTDDQAKVILRGVIGSEYFIGEMNEMIDQECENAGYVKLH